MTTLLEAAQQALEALKNNAGEMRVEGAISILETALRAALAQQDEPVEPVAWECKAGGLKPLTQRQYDAQTANIRRHYTRIAPPQRKPLTEEEMYSVEEEARKSFRQSQRGVRGQQITYWDGLTPWLIRAVERAHGIKEAT